MRFFVLHNVYTMYKSTAAKKIASNCFVATYVTVETSFVAFWQRCTFLTTLSFFWQRCRFLSIPFLQRCHFCATLSFWKHVTWSTYKLLRGIRNGHFHRCQKENYPVKKLINKWGGKGGAKRTPKKFWNLDELQVCTFCGQRTVLPTPQRTQRTNQNNFFKCCATWHLVFFDMAICNAKDFSTYSVSYLKIVKKTTRVPSFLRVEDENTGHYYTITC